jgi:plastocyanin
MEVLRSLRYLGALSTLTLMIACGSETGPDPDPGNPTMAAVSGSGQSATVGEEVANDLVVRITQDGAGVSGTTVSWSVTGGGGSVAPTSSTTDNSGNASTTWTLGASAGANFVEASSSGIAGSPVEFTATGVEDTPPPTQANVSVQDNTFVPASSTIAEGGQVTWTWAGAVDHNVTFATGPNSGDQTSGTFSRTFSTAGSFPYQCTIHGSSMSGTVTVQ